METKTETRWVVRTERLPEVDVEPVEYEHDTCSLGLYETERAAWAAAEEHVLRCLMDYESAKRIVVEDLNRRIRQTEASMHRVREHLHDKESGR